jgi:hypothetical protein
MSNSANATQRANDLLEIQQVGNLFAHGIDFDVDAFDRCMTDDTEVIYAMGTWRGIDEQKKRTRITKRDVFSFTQHALTNPIIALDGDRANVRWYVSGNHGMKAERGYIIRVGAIYTHDLARTPRGWRIMRHHCEVVWTDDPKGLMRTQVHQNFDALINNG